LLLTTIENTEWIGAERNGPLPTNNKLYENTPILKQTILIPEKNLESF
jgi:hypothetical protein